MDGSVVKEEQEPQEKHLNWRGEDNVDEIDKMSGIVRDKKIPRKRIKRKIYKTVSAVSVAIRS
jgi:hypothetical protein